MQSPYQNSNTGTIAPPPDEQAQYDAEKENDKKQQIYFTRLEIDKYEKAIEHCRDEIVQLDLKLADSNLPVYRQNRTQLMSLKEFRQKNLAEAETNLTYSKKKLAELTGEPLDGQPSANTGTDPYYAYGATEV